MKYRELMASLLTETGIGMRTVINTISEYKKKKTGELKLPSKRKFRQTWTHD